MHLSNNMLLVIKNILIVALILIFEPPCKAATAIPEFAVLVTGTAEIAVYSSSQRIMSKRTREFTGTFRGNQWQITTRPKEQILLNPALAQRFEKMKRESKQKTGYTSSDMAYISGSDGKDTYSLFVLGEDKQLGDVKVRRSAVPLNEGYTLITPIWIAYSNFRFDGDKTQRPLWPLVEQAPIWQLNHMFELRSHRDESGTVTSLSQLDGGILYTKNSTSPRNELVKSQRQGMYSAGFERVKCNFKGWIDLGEERIPKETTVAILELERKNDGTENVYTQSVCTVETLTVRRVPSLSDYRPTLGTHTPMVSDLRYTDANNRYIVSYIASNSVWLPVNDPRLKNELLHAGHFNERDRHQSAYRKYVATAAFFLFATVTLGCWQILRKQNNKTKQ